MTWDIAVVGDQRVVTVRLFDAKAAKGVGRGQAKTDDVDALSRHASIALQTAVDRFFDSLLDDDTRAQETFDEKKVGVGEVRVWLSKERRYWRGANRVPIEAQEFYRAVGREEDALQVESDTCWSVFLRTSGAVSGGLGFAFFFPGIILLGVGSSLVGVPLFLAAVPFVFAVPLFAVGFGLLGASVIFQPVPKPIEEDREMADQFNQRLRRGLGLADDVALLLPTPVHLAIGHNLE